MISIEKVLFPSILVGCMVTVFVTGWIARPQPALASMVSAENRAAAEYQAQTQQEIPVVIGIAEQAEQPAAAGADAAGASVPEIITNLEEPLFVPIVPPEQPAEISGACTLSSGYPETILQWCGLIELYAAENGVEANLIAAVMFQESGGNPQAYSKSGAVGLMQVMPRDGLAAGFMCINGPCFRSRPSMQELYDPAFNISYGTRMLAELIRKHGTARDALRAYGPMDMGYRYADIVLGIADRYR